MSYQYLVSISDMFYKKALSLVCQQLGLRIEKISPDTKFDSELRALLHIIHLYDDMDDENESLEGLLKELSEEGVVLTKEFLASARSAETAKKLENASKEEGPK